MLYKKQIPFRIAMVLVALLFTAVGGVVYFEYGYLGLLGSTLVSALLMALCWKKKPNEKVVVLFFVLMFVSSLILGEILGTLFIKAVFGIR